ncbi:MAG: hypothetical protein K6G25_06600 [Bacteroidales bacterium]|nr:hypothetical protein [Bacteroidales bacterium]
MTKSLFKYQNKAAYNAATERPANRSTVSLAAGEVIYVGKNVILPYRKSTVEYADKVIFDRADKCLRIIKYSTYDAADLATCLLADGTTPRFWWGGAVHFGYDNGKALAVDADCQMNGNSETMMFADNTYFRITGFTFVEGVLQAGSMTLTVRTGDFNSTVALEWETGDTLEAIAADGNTKRNGKTSFGFVALEDGTGLGVWMTTYSYNNLSTAAEGITIACTKVCDAEGTDTETDAKPQIGTMPTYDGRMKTAGTAVIRINGATSTSAPACIDQVDYYWQQSTNGLQSFKTEKEGTVGMTRTVFNSLASYLIGSVERKLYDKYDGDYAKYIEPFLVPKESRIGAMADSVNDMWMQNFCAAQLFHKDYNGVVRPMYPAIYNTFSFVPDGMPDEAASLFGAGCHMVPNNHAMVQLVKDISRNGTFVTTAGREDKLNRSMSDFDDYRAIKGSETIWTCCEATGPYAWFLAGGYGYVNYYVKSAAYRVRRVLAFEIPD